MSSLMDYQVGFDDGYNEAFSQVLEVIEGGITLNELRNLVKEALDEGFEGEA